MVRALQPLVRRAAHTAGCLGAHLSADVNEADVFWYFQDWDNPRALDDDIASDEFGVLLAVMETSAEPPFLQFRIVDELRGLEYVEAVRTKRMGGEYEWT